MIPLLNRIFPKDMVFLHIGKTGGSALRAGLRQVKSNTSFLNHSVTLSHALRSFPRSQIGFVVRDPVSRTTSGFYSRLRKGAPRYHNEWTYAERVIFTRWPTMDTLGESMQAGDPEALEAASSITHVRKGLAHYLGDVDLLQSASDRIGFVGHQETLNSDVQWLSRELGVDIAMPSDDNAAHRSPDGQTNKRLSADAEAAVRAYHAADFPIYDWCLRKRKELGIG